MSNDKYADDTRLSDLSEYIFLKRGSDIIADAIIYRGDCWWKVLGNGFADGTDIIHAEKAGSLEGGPEEVTIPIDERTLYPVVSGGAPLQFQDGALLDGRLWPGCGLIYVKHAVRRGEGVDSDERVFGIFALRYDSDGGPYYAPVDPASQPGVASDWLLDQRFDLILDWEPVDVAELLREYSGKNLG
jgi:hypothetical protein|nr:MAG TPA: hypothetical protein [Caudoviricetes sp.]